MEIYHRRRQQFLEEERRLARISLRFSLVRGVLFAGFVAGLFAILLNAGAPPPWTWAAAAGFLAAFVFILPYHDRAIGRQRQAAMLARLNEESLRRIERDWDAFPLPGFPAPEEERPLARDLNLFGRASLFHLLGTANTPPGKATLAGWLLRPAPPEEIAARQRAVAELAPELDLRQRLEQRARPLGQVSPDIEPFLRWAEGRPWLLQRPWLVWLSRALALLTPLTVVAYFAEALPAWPFLLAITVNTVVTYLFREPVEHAFDLVQAREGEFQLYGHAMALIDERRFESPRLRHIHEDLAPQGRPAHRWMELLHRRVELSDARHSGVLMLVLQTIFLWNFHTLWLLERWQVQAGRHARRWLGALGEFEALAALAGLAHDNPEWAFPTVGPAEDRLAGQALGHPLLSAAQRVSNDVEVGPPGSFLLVTGSNMSGKSTLLRAIGLNAILAQAGGPACAAGLRLPPLALATSILVEDSLADGVSFFMAELKRIREVVDEADRCRAEGRILLYLLDEILRGTNSEERLVAVRRVVRHLLKTGAVGAVSTHDLRIAEIEELAEAARPVHFRETLHPGGDPPMTFDYQMRPGVATTVNALRLMEMVGLRPE